MNQELFGQQRGKLQSGTVNSSPNCVGANAASAFGLRSPSGTLVDEIEYRIHVCDEIDGALQRASSALAASDYDGASAACVAGLRVAGSGGSHLTCARAELMSIRAAVERDRGNLVASMAFYSRGQELAESADAHSLAARCAVGKVTVGRIAITHAKSEPERLAFIELTRRFIERAAAPVYRGGDGAEKADLSFHISSWHSTIGNSELAQAEFRMNVLPLASEQEDRGLLLAYILGEVRVLIQADPRRHAKRIESGMSVADEIRAREVRQPLRLMQHDVAWAQTFIAFGEMDNAERKLIDANEILQDHHFSNHTYDQTVSNLERLL